MVLEHGSPLGLDGKNVFFIHTCQFHTCYLYFWSMCLLCMHGGGSCVFMWNIMVIIVGCGHHQCI